MLQQLIIPSNEPILVMLAKIEIQALTEKSRAVLHLDEVDNTRCTNSFDAGLLLAEISQSKQSFSYRESCVLESVISLLDSAPYLATGYEYALENMEDIDIYIDDENTFELIDGDAINNVVHNHAKALEPFLPILSKVTDYESLKCLDRNVLSLLVDFESAKVDAIESRDETIDGRTSGHHADCLSIYRSALDGSDLTKGCFVYMGDDGEFYFNIVEGIQFYLDQPSTTFTAKDYDHASLVD